MVRASGHDVHAITHGGWLGRAFGQGLQDSTWGKCEWLVKSLLLSNTNKITVNGI